MKKRIMLIIAAILFLIIIFIGYKYIILSKYDTQNLLNESPNFFEHIKIKNKINVNSSDPVNEYLNFKNVYIRNDFKNFTYLTDSSDEDSAKYVLYDENNNVKASFWITITEEYVDLLDNVSFYSINETTKENDYSYIKSILHEKNILNDIELINFASSYDFNNHNIFTSVKKIKGDYKLLQSLLIAFPDMEYITEISGDYDGYIFNINVQTKEVSILKNDKRYVFTFISKEYFSNEDMSDLINTILIK